METYSKIDLLFESDFNEDFHCESLNDERGAISILLRGSKSKSALNINFEFVYSYCKTNESYRLETNNALPNGRYILLKVTNSEYLNWFHRESMGIYESQNIFHFIFVTEDDFVDVLAAKLPIVEYKKSDCSHPVEISLN